MMWSFIGQEIDSGIVRVKGLLVILAEINDLILYL